MTWSVKFHPEAVNDFSKLDGSQRILVSKALEKVRQNPVSIFEQGYGKPLGNKDTANLSGYLKIRIKNSGIRIIYQLIKTETVMLIIVIGMRKDDEVYKLAFKRIKKNQEYIK